MNNNWESDRRKFLKTTAALGGAALLATTFPMSAALSNEEKKMSITLQITAKLKPDSYEALGKFFEENLPNSRSAKGCRHIEIFFDEKKENLLVLEEWLSKADHEAYVKMITENGVMKKLVTFFDGDPSVTYFEKSSF